MIRPFDQLNNFRGASGYFNWSMDSGERSQHYFAAIYFKGKSMLQALLRNFLGSDIISSCCDVLCPAQIQ